MTKNLLITLLLLTYANLFANTTNENDCTSDCPFRTQTPELELERTFQDLLQQDTTYVRVVIPVGTEIPVLFATQPAYPSAKRTAILITTKSVTRNGYRLLPAGARIIASYQVHARSSFIFTPRHLALPNGNKLKISAILQNETAGITNELFPIESTTKGQMGTLLLVEPLSLYLESRTPPDCENEADQGIDSGASYPKYLVPVPPYLPPGCIPPTYLPSTPWYYTPKWP